MAKIGIVFGRNSLRNEFMGIDFGTLVSNSARQESLLFLEDREYKETSGEYSEIKKVIEDNSTSVAHLFLHGRSDGIHESQKNFLASFNIVPKSTPMTFSHESDQLPFKDLLCVFNKEEGWEETLSVLLGKLELRENLQILELAALGCVIHALSPNDITENLRNELLYQAQDQLPSLISNTEIFESLSSDKAALDLLSVKEQSLFNNCQ